MQMHNYSNSETKLKSNSKTSESLDKNLFIRQLSKENSTGKT